MKKSVVILVLVLVVLIVAVLIVFSGSLTGAVSSDVEKKLANVRQLTDKYHDVNTALADGYVPAGPCVESPAGVMGIHYLNPILANDTVVDELKPEILLYVNTNAGPRLVGVEYYTVNVGQPTPYLFSRAMDGPMPGHEPGQPEHYDLHVWIWQANPSGMFAEFNPTLKC